MIVARAVAGAVVLAAVAGCGGGDGGAHHRPATVDGQIPAKLAAEARPIGRGTRFHLPARGPGIGACRRTLQARDAVHVELFAADRVVLLASGIGTQPPRRRQEGRITAARCYGALVTLEPTGVVLVRHGVRLTVADLFRSWGQRLSSHRLAGFTGRSVTAYVNGRRQRGRAGEIVLRRHDEIVVEVGPYVPPHATYRFPPGG